jgi:hypothetical protein
MIPQYSTDLGKTLAVIIEGKKPGLVSRLFFFMGRVIPLRYSSSCSSQ